jgi:hypothetical protein
MLSMNKINLFLLLKLPMAYFAGIRVVALQENLCRTRARLWWFTKNPFGSMYFAVQMMAAELATGVLVLGAVRNSRHSISMLVTSCGSTYHKKVTGAIFFTCLGAEEIRVAVENTIRTGQPSIIKLISTGTDDKGDSASEMWFEWHLRLKR